MYLLVNECFVYIIFPYEYNYSIENLIARFSLFYLYMVDFGVNGMCPTPVQCGPDACSLAYSQCRYAVSVYYSK